MKDHISDNTNLYEEILDILRKQDGDFQTFIKDTKLYEELLKNKRPSSKFGNLQKVIDICKSVMYEEDSLQVQYNDTGALIFLDSDLILV